MTAAAGVAVLLLASVSPLVAQDDCIFRIEHVGGQGTTQETPLGTNYFAAGGVRLFCLGTAVRMESDSVAAYNGGEITYFVGNVHFRDSTMTLDADRGTWYQAGARWEARGNVFTRNLENGSTLTGPHLDYLRNSPGIRDVAEMYAIGRPRIESATIDSAGNPTEPHVIVADRVRMRGDDQMWAGGTVTIDRSDFTGRSDSLWLYSGAAGKGALIGGRPEIDGTGESPYRLVGERIDLELTGGTLSRVVALDSAHAVNDEWDLVGDTIAVHLDQDSPDRIDAWGKGIRPLATSDEYTILADSVALHFPGGMLSRLDAVGDAKLETGRDSLTGEADWIAGDTVTAWFVAPDSAGDGSPALERLVATSQARSFRQMRQPTQPMALPSLSYVRGDMIVITMKLPPLEGVDRVDVKGQVEGVQLDPEPGQAVPPSPSPASSDQEDG